MRTATLPKLRRESNLSTKIDISGLDKADVLAALYNGSKVQGMGVFQAVGAPDIMSHDMAQLVIGEKYHDVGSGYTGQDLSFGYIFGRVLHVDISADEFDPWSYDRDLGAGAAQKVIDQLRLLTARKQ